MKQLSKCVAAATPAPWGAVLCSVGLVLAIAPPLAAQGTRVVVSTTNNVGAAAGVAFPVGDGDLVVVEPGSEVSPFFADGHFLATTGFVPGDIDGFAHIMGPLPGRAESLAFSLLSNEGGFLDGDVLGLEHGGGATLLISELDLLAAMGAAGANIDLDAFTYDDQGRLLFSLGADLGASALGPVEDGDVLRLEPGFIGVTRILTEADVQARFTQATGLTSAILDVQALDWAAGELWTSVQAPSRHDGSIFSLNGTARLVIDENDLGLGGEEVDALGDLRTGDEIPVFHIAPNAALPGDVAHVEVRGRPGAVLLVLMAGNTGFIDWARYPGFGGWYLNPNDPWFLAMRTAHGRPMVGLDGAGKFAVDFGLPPGTLFGVGIGGEAGWSFQVLDLMTREVSAPFRLSKL
jgi:hypothetical protein